MRHFLIRALFVLLTAGFLHAQTANETPDEVPAASAKPAPFKLPEGSQKVVFGKGGTQDLRALILPPKGATGPAPAYIWIHGGGWQGGSFLTGAGDFHKMVDQGYLVMSIEYRLSKDAKWPAQIEDCLLAVRWLRANAAKYNVDPNRICAAGASAGGHLAVCVGTMADVKAYQGTELPGISSAVQAVVDYFGPTDFITPNIYSERATGYKTNLIGKSKAEAEELWRAASPALQVKAGNPPMLILHGLGDTLVPPGQAKSLDEALTKSGVPHEVIMVKNAGHGLRPGIGKTMEPTTEAMDAALIAFCDKYVKNLGAGKKEKAAPAAPRTP